MNSSRSYAGIDYFRLIAAFLIVAIHTAPLSSVDETASFMFTHILARIAVPFFLLVTGYFLLAPFYADTPLPPSAKGLKQFSIKTALLYGASILLYLPVNLYAGHFETIDGWGALLKMVIFDGTMYHLWYLPASIIGAAIVFSLLKCLKPKYVWVAVSLLYLIGLGGDSYYGLAAGLPWLNAGYDFMFGWFDYTRNGIFYAPIFLLLGAALAHPRRPAAKTADGIGLAVSLALLLAEGLLLHNAGVQRHDSMYLALLPSMYFLYRLLLHCPGKRRYELRTVAMLIYILHPLVIVVVRLIAKLLGLQAVLVYNSVIHYTLVCLLSWLAAVLITRLKDRLAPVKPDRKSRVWREINLGHLGHNLRFLQMILPSSCEVMAVVKADAYGHGAIKISRELNLLGIRDFATATVAEAVELRRHGIKGNILILGPTAPDDFPCLTRYHLTQTVTDHTYARRLNRHGQAVDVHIKLDTGMHRLGEDYGHLSELEDIFACQNLRVKGTYTHLCAADSLQEEDIAFSRLQMRRFYDAVKQLEQHGHHPGKLHIQSSYGVLNHPELQCDYARVGIALYGVLSTSAPTFVTPDLKPVLALKARIMMTRSIAAGESVGYGRQFTAPQAMTIAVVSAGYADGIPRQLSAPGSAVLVRERRAPVIGRICMDQMLVDVSQIPEVQPGDCVTLIGRDGDEEIRSEEIAAHCHTITNEVLSRLGKRTELFIAGTEK
ncbi:MAG: serine racemase VanT catalytic subunit [Syntrophomonadaceae bacterium]|nr:serine racemase VanT catalytic subunit [Syntrophomonadaceae bacterium]